MIGITTLCRPPVFADNATAKPIVVVDACSTAGLLPWWGKNVDAGNALADLVSLKLAADSRYLVKDRARITAALAEEQASSLGDVDSVTLADVERRAGAEFALQCRVVQLGKAPDPGSGFEGRSQTLHVSMKIVDLNTGAIVGALESDNSVNAPTVQAVLEGDIV